MNNRKTLVSRACDRCKTKKRRYVSPTNIRCDGLNPCITCAKLHQNCNYSIVQKKRGPVPKEIPNGKTLSSSSLDTEKQSKSSQNSPTDPDRSSFETSETKSSLYPDLFDTLKFVQDLNTDCKLNPALVSTSEKFEPYIKAGLPRLSDECYLDILGCYFLLFNRMIPLFDPKTFFSSIPNEIPNYLFAAVCSIGCVYSRHPSLMTQVHMNLPEWSVHFVSLANAALPQHYQTVQEKVAISQCTFLLTIHDLGVRGGDSAWVWNGIGVQIVKESLGVFQNDLISKQLWSSCFVVDFIHSLSSGLLMALDERDYSYLPEYLKCQRLWFEPVTLHTNYLHPFYSPSGKAVSSKDLNICFEDCAELVELVYLGRRVVREISKNANVAELHNQLISFWQNLSPKYKLVFSIDTLAQGGRSLYSTNEWSNNLTEPPIPSVLINLLFFGILSSLHQYNFKAEQAAVCIDALKNEEKLDPMNHYMRARIESSAGFVLDTSQMNHLRSSIEILQACYRAQCRVLSKIAANDYYQACILPILHMMLLPSVLTLLQIPQCAADLVFYTSQDKIRNMFSLESIDINILPALINASWIWPVIKVSVNNLQKLLEKVRTDLRGDALKQMQSTSSEEQSLVDTSTTSSTTPREMDYNSMKPNASMRESGEKEWKEIMDNVNEDTQLDLINVGFESLGPV